MAILLLLSTWAQSHPLCGLDAEYSYSPAAAPLSFCSQYAESTCCSLTDDQNIQDAVEALNLSDSCVPMYKQFACARCDPYQSHLFNLESADADRTEPFLCDAFCQNLTSVCSGEVSVDCNQLVGPAPYCLPVELPETGHSGLDIYDVIPGANFLIDYADPGDGREFYSTFDGLFYEVSTGSPRLVFTIRDVFVQGELGFLTFELDPGFLSNNILWTYHAIQESLGGGNRRFTVLSRVTLAHQHGQDPEWCEILRLEQAGWNHNGGDIHFDAEGRLILAVGDDAPQNGNGNAQDLSNLYGSIIRILPSYDTCNTTVYRDPDLIENVKRTITENYAIPVDNPFVNVSGVRPEIIAYGFRNPWRTFTTSEGQVYIGDVGQQLWEEVDLLKVGKNYGWDITEGDNCFGNQDYECQVMENRSDYERPIYDYPHPPRLLRPFQQHTGYSITLGHIYTGSIRPDLHGKVLMADYINQNIWAIVPVGNPWRGAEMVVQSAGKVVSIRKNSQNETVILTQGDTSYQLKPLDSDNQATFKNGVCEQGENCKQNPYDCPGNHKGSNKWCCGDGICLEGNCTVNCSATAYEIGCGNNYCDPGENCTSCAWDCPGHTSQGNGGAQFCCVGSEWGVTCVGEDCNDDSCKRGNKQGDKNFKNEHD